MYKQANLFHTINGDFMEQFMSSPVIVGKLEDSIGTIAEQMKQHNIGFLPIAKENKIVGVITDRDLVIKALANHADSTSPIENYITHHVIYIEQNASTQELLELMSHTQVKRILVTNQKKVVGVISISDLLDHVQEKQLVDTLKQIDQNRVHEAQEDLEIDSFYL